MNLKQLIKKGKFYYVNSSITEANFPAQKVQTKGWRLIKMEKSFTSKEALARIKKEGCRPANIYELLQWKIDHGEKEMPEGEWSSEIALGQLWTDDFGCHRGPRVFRYSDGVFSLGLDHFERDCFADPCLLCFSNDLSTSDTKKSSDALTLVAAQLEKVYKELDEIKNILKLK